MHNHCNSRNMKYHIMQRGFQGVCIPWIVLSTNLDYPPPPPGLSNDGVPNFGIPKTAILGTSQFGPPGFSCRVPTTSVVRYASCSRSRAPVCLITVAVGNPLHFLSSRLRGCDGVWSFEEILTDNVHGCFVRNVSSYLGLSKKLLHADVLDWG